MIAERPDIGACYCAATPCVCPPQPTRAHLVPCTDTDCHATALGVGEHFHQCADTGCTTPGCPSA